MGGLRGGEDGETGVGGDEDDSQGGQMVALIFSELAERKTRLRRSGTILLMALFAARSALMSLLASRAEIEASSSAGSLVRMQRSGWSGGIVSRRSRRQRKTQMCKWTVCFVGEGSQLHIGILVGRLFGPLLVASSYCVCNIYHMFGQT